VICAFSSTKLFPRNQSDAIEMRVIRRASLRKRQDRRVTTNKRDAETRDAENSTASALSGSTLPLRTERVDAASTELPAGGRI